jgi:flagellar basal-body rod modification protein FlgD
MTSTTNPLSTPVPNSTPTPSSTDSTSVTDPLANQDVFLQLLVAQLENQDPEDPADGTAFITQLAQFSTLSNSAQMLTDLGAIQQSVATLAAAVPASSTSGTSSSSS